MLDKVYHSVRRFFKPQMYWTKQDVESANSRAMEMSKFFKRDMTRFEGKLIVRTEACGIDKSFMTNPIRVVKVENSLIYYKSIHTSKVCLLSAEMQDDHWEIVDESLISEPK